MRHLIKSTLLGGVALAVVATATPAFAQDTSSGVRGVVTSPSGSVLAGQTVIIMDTRTGSTKTVTTNSSGGFSSRGLRVGGPYTS